MIKLIPILFLFILVSCNTKEKEPEPLLAADREAQIGWVVFKAYPDKTFMYSLSSREMFKGTYKLNGDTLFLTCSDTTIGIDTAIIRNQSLEFFGKKSPRFASITINKLSPLTKEEKTCNCEELLEKEKKGVYLAYKNGESNYYSGYCKLTRENGNEINYKYQDGQILQIIERYKTGTLCEVVIYDYGLTGEIIEHTRYYPNGSVAYKNLNGDHSYESFYENGNIQRKGFYGVYGKSSSYRELHKSEKIIFDSIWKKNGSFDSVYHYSEESITY